MVCRCNYYDGISNTSIYRWVYQLLYYILYYTYCCIVLSWRVGQHRRNVQCSSVRRTSYIDAAFVKFQHEYSRKLKNLLHMRNKQKKPPINDHSNVFNIPRFILVCKFEFNNDAHTKLRFCVNLHYEMKFSMVCLNYWRADRSAWKIRCMQCIQKSQKNLHFDILDKILEID